MISAHFRYCERFHNSKRRSLDAKPVDCIGLARPSQQHLKSDVDDLELVSEQLHEAVDRGLGSFRGRQIRPPAIVIENQYSTRGQPGPSKYGIEKDVRRQMRTVYIDNVKRRGSEVLGQCVGRCLMNRTDTICDSGDSNVVIETDLDFRTPWIDASQPAARARENVLDEPDRGPSLVASYFQHPEAGPSGEFRQMLLPDIRLEADMVPCEKRFVQSGEPRFLPTDSPAASKVSVCSDERVPDCHLSEDIFR